MGRGSSEDEERAGSVELPALLAPRGGDPFTRYEQARERAMEQLLTGSDVPATERQLCSEIDRWLLLAYARPPRRKDRWELTCFPTLQKAAEHSIGLLCEPRDFYCVYDLAAYDPARSGLAGIERVVGQYNVEVPKVLWPNPRPSKAHAARNGAQLYTLYPTLEPKNAEALNGEKRFIGVVSRVDGTRIRLLSWSSEPPEEDLRSFWNSTGAFLGLYDLYGADGPERVPLKARLMMRSTGITTIIVERTFP